MDRLRYAIYVKFNTLSNCVYSWHTRDLLNSILNRSFGIVFEPKSRFAFEHATLRRTSFVGRVIGRRWLRNVSAANRISVLSIQQVSRENWAKRGDAITRCIPENTGWQHEWTRVHEARGMPNIPQLNWPCGAIADRDLSAINKSRKRRLVRHSRALYRPVRDIRKKLRLLKIESF